MDFQKIRESRLSGLEETIGYYEALCKEGHRLSDGQREQLETASNAAACFGEYGQFLCEVGKELLEKY